MSNNDAVIGWHATSYDPALASIRLRLLQPVSYLQEKGVLVEIYDPEKGVNSYEGVIFSKSMGQDALDIARALKAAGKTVVYDICDNIFEAKASGKKQKRLRILREMLALADVIVFSTPVLRDQILARMPDLAAQTVVIPDMLEDFSNPPALRNVASRWRVAALRRFHANHRGALRCIWFGKCQGNLAGLVHVDAAVRELEVFAQSHAVTLTVVGNKRLLYWMASRKWRIPHIYLPWAADSFPHVLRSHEVAVIPLERNGYTVGKTINRPATAINAGLGVIAGSIDAYEELRPHIELDDWQRGLAHYGRFRESSDPRIDLARAHLSQHHGTQRTGGAWLQLVLPLVTQNVLAVGPAHSASSATQFSMQRPIAQ